MSSRFHQPAGGLRSIYCAVVEVPAVSDPFDPRPQRGFQDLVPWADPYIASLIEKLRRSAEAGGFDAGAAAELPPPLDSQDDPRDRRSGDWRPRNWPGE
jgi:hypothetical protein